MLKKILLSSSILSVSLFASSAFIPNLNQELKDNQELIKNHKNNIKKLEKRNKVLLKAKKEDPKLYESKPLYENTKKAYIYRIRLNGADTKNINFTIKNHILSIQMDIKTTRNDKNGYFESSRFFYQEYSIPKNVQESKISHKKIGNYYVITMPKK